MDRQKISLILLDIYVLLYYNKLKKLNSLQKVNKHKILNFVKIKTRKMGLSGFTTKKEFTKFLNYIQNRYNLKFCYKKIPTLKIQTELEKNQRTLDEYFIK